MTGYVPALPRDEESTLIRIVCHHRLPLSVSMPPHLIQRVVDQRKGVRVHPYTAACRGTRLWLPTKLKRQPHQIPLGDFQVLKPLSSTNFIHMTIPSNGRLCPQTVNSLTRRLQHRSECRRREQATTEVRCVGQQQVWAEGSEKFNYDAWWSGSSDELPNSTNCSICDRFRCNATKCFSG